jgi:putative flippase GtrA
VIHTPTSLSVLRFLVIGTTSALLNLVLLWVMGSVCGLWYAGSSAAAYGVSAVYNFLLQRSWAFDGVNGRASEQVPQFAIVNVLGLLLNTSIFCVLVARIGTPYLIAQAVASMAVALVSFFAYRRIFNGPPRSLVIGLACYRGD